MEDSTLCPHCTTHDKYLVFYLCTAPPKEDWAMAVIGDAKKEDVKGQESRR